MQVPPNQPPQFSVAPPPPQAQLPKKKNTTLIVILVALVAACLFCCVIGAAILFPVFNQARLAARRSVLLVNARQVALGAVLFANDHDDCLPDTKDARAFQAMVMPYVKDASIFTNPVTHSPSS